ncbi:MAG: ArnT family glycosyltransferase, partial [Thermodesulfobacteriota bacterium]
MLKKMISSDSMTNSAENNRRGEAGIIRFFISMPVWAKLLLLVIAALIPRIIVLLQPQIITNDGVLYVRMAKLFAEGKYAGTPGSYFNLYPFLIFLVQKVIGDWELSGQLISLVLGTLAVIPVFLLGRSLYGERISWLSAIFYITLPNLLKFDAQVIRDPTLWFFILVTMWLVWEGNQKKQPLLFALASLSGGLGALTRVEGFVVWTALAFYIAFKKTVSTPIKRKILSLSLFVLIFPVLISPILFSFEKTESGMAIGEMTSFSLAFIKAHAGTVLRPQDPIDILGEKVYSTLPTISRDALELASRHRIVLAIFEVIYKFFKSANLLIILVLLGFWKRRKEGFSPSDKFLLYIFSILFVMSLFYTRQIYYFSTRHGLTLVLPCLFFVGHGLYAAVANISRWMERIGFRWTLIRKYVYHLVVPILVILFLVQRLLGGGAEKTAIKEVGIWLSQNGYRGSVVMGPKKFLRLGFYADGAFTEMPVSVEKAIETIRENKVKIVAIDSCT